MAGWERTRGPDGIAHAAALPSYSMPAKAVQCQQGVAGAGWAGVMYRMPPMLAADWLRG